MEDVFHLGIKALIRNKQGKILLLKVNPKKLMRDKKLGLTAKPYWDVPGGRLNKKAKVKETLIREIKEETGIDRLKEMKVFTMVLSNIRVPHGNESAGLILYIFTCLTGARQKIELSSEHIEFGWFPPKRAARLLKIKYPKEFTEKIKELG